MDVGVVRSANGATCTWETMPTVNQETSTVGETCNVKTHVMLRTPETGNQHVARNETGLDVWVVTGGRAFFVVGGVRREKCTPTHPHPRQSTLYTQGHLPTPKRDAHAGNLHTRTIFEMRATETGKRERSGHCSNCNCSCKARYHSVHVYAYMRIRRRAWM